MTPKNHLLWLRAKPSNSQKAVAQKLEQTRKLMRGCRLVWSRLVDLGSIDPGSNPGSPIIPINRALLISLKSKCMFYSLDNNVSDPRPASPQKDLNRYWLANRHIQHVPDFAYLCFNGHFWRSNPFACVSGTYWLPYCSRAFRNKSNHSWEKIIFSAKSWAQFPWRLS